MADDVKPTRSEELRLKESIELAENGHEILEKKRDGLIHEFMQIVDEAKASREQLSSTFSEAREDLKLAEVYDGREQLTANAAGSELDDTVLFDQENIMGVVVPEIEFSSQVRRSPDERGYSISSSTSRIDKAADQYEKLLEQAVKAAEIQTKVKKMLDEIEKTKRRVNALEHKVIPEMQESLDEVSQTLMEREREETFRMKKVKEMQD